MSVQISSWANVGVLGTNFTAHHGLTESFDDRHDDRTKDQLAEWANPTSDQSPGRVLAPSFVTRSCSSAQSPLPSCV
ncbi:unnamed protein product [Protopolystoma xenopodis]|uniref:Uncharacterized protein n=1 Tax=Protopolystoma xenopodis TaxID=117903 RepID=A0A3S5A644_9PLAT|nr:unnamed protein product [Protopolystoma xenopodis]